MQKVDASETLTTTEDARRTLNQTASLSNRIQALQQQVGKMSESNTTSIENVESFEEIRAQLNAYRESLNNPDCDSVLTLDPVADALISTAVTVATLSDTGPVHDATTMRQHIDSKAYRERQRKRIAMGRNPDDHEDEKPAWSQTMM